MSDLPSIEFLRRIVELPEDANTHIANMETAYSQALAELARLRSENEALREAFQSIANNSCCDRCQEAALVARAALKGADK